ncbi:MAG: precorrin-2 C(20)-methyltransferase [Colwellia sp.]|nr:precorrin-2 C(20)-methyltransferase [Colwellia sp.]
MTNISENKKAKQHGTFIGVGVGPGDPQLMTLKAYQLIINADVICYLTDKNDYSHAKDIARHAVAKMSADSLEIAMFMPMEKDRTKANVAYDKGSKEISSQLSLGKNVIFLCEGDPLFFGSYSYLLERLQDNFICQVVPGISSVNAAASALVRPLTALTDSFAVLSGRHSEELLQQSLRQHDSLVIMKAGKSRPKILAALLATNRIEDASYLEYIGRENEFIENDVSQLANEAGPYFSLFVVRNKTPMHNAKPVLQYN